MIIWRQLIIANWQVFERHGVLRLERLWTVNIFPVIICVWDPINLAQIKAIIIYLTRVPGFLSPKATKSLFSLPLHHQTSARDDGNLVLYANVLSKCTNQRLHQVGSFKWFLGCGWGKDGGRQSALFTRLQMSVNVAALSMNKSEPCKPWLASLKRNNSNNNQGYRL